MHAMHEMQPIVTDVSVRQSINLSVRLSGCLSRRLTRLHCAKTAQRIKMLFRVNTPGAHGTLCYTWVLILHRQGEGPAIKFWDSPRISGTAEARLEILRAYRGMGALTRIMQK